MAARCLAENLLVETELFPNSCFLLGIKFLSVKFGESKFFLSDCRVSLNPEKRGMGKTAWILECGLKLFPFLKKIVIGFQNGW